MGNRLAHWVIAALLTFQLVIGVRQAAHADMALPQLQASGVDARHCPDHASRDSGSERRGAGASTSASSPDGTATVAHEHDCCGSLDCQGHCAQAVGVLNLPLASVFCCTSFLLPFFDAQPPVARTNELFRPPIA
jgi:hypothetical protein